MLSRKKIEPVRQYFDEINRDLNKYLISTSKEDITDVVPAEKLTGDDEFYNYICESNDRSNISHVVLTYILYLIPNNLLTSDFVCFFFQPKNDLISNEQVYSGLNILSFKFCLCLKLLFQTGITQKSLTMIHIKFDHTDPYLE